MPTIKPYTSFQKTNCGRASTNGSPRRIRQLTITLRVILITTNLQPGSSKEACTRNGNQKARSFGFTESVRQSKFTFDTVPSGCLDIVASSGKSKTLKPYARLVKYRWHVSISISISGTPTNNLNALRDLFPSPLTQLSAHSSSCDILSKLNLTHDIGKNQPSDSVLTKYLKDMLTLHDQRPIYFSWTHSMSLR